MDIIHRLKKILPKHALLHTSEYMRPFECDGLSAYRGQPLAVVLPENTAQIKAVVQLCHKSKTPLISRGAGTGLTGGAMPTDGSVVLGLSKLSRIKSIDPDKRLAVVEPGVRNIAISEAVRAHGLYYAPDPSSQIACSIGGNVAENSGGLHCLKYGLTIHNIESINVLTIDGKTLTFARDDDGLGLLALFTGSEGLLGIITEITVRLTALPAHTKLFVAGFKRVADCADVVGEIIKAGIIPAGLEMMDKFAIQAAEEFAKVGYPLDAEALLLCELDGEAGQIAAHEQILMPILKTASSIQIAQSEAERIALWAGRKSAFPAVGRYSPDYYCMDGTIPRRHLAEVLAEISRLSVHYQLQVANVFHAGDGNLHPLILYDASIDGELKKAEQFGGDILKLSVEKGGSITGEHGVGVEKLNAMCHQFGADELDIFHQIKSALDPNELLNPGKAIPTLHRCAELGAMHVHNGKLPHPDLPRF